MPKPVTAFTWATDANFGSGPAIGNPTKVNPPGWPNVTQGNVPDLTIVAEFQNTALNHIGDWVQWLDDGASSGAADAHIVETDALGDTAVQDLSAVDIATTGDVAVGGDLSVDDGYIRQSWSHIEWLMYQSALADWPAAIHPTPWSENATISGVLLNSTAPPVVSLPTNGTTNLGSVGPVSLLFFDPDRGFVFEWVSRITSVVTDIQINHGIDNQSIPMTNTDDGVAVTFDTSLGDTFWTLEGADSATLTRVASSVAPVQNVWHKFRVTVNPDRSAELLIDDVSEATLAAGDIGPDSAMGYTLFITGIIASVRTVEVERWSFWQPPNA